MMKVIDILWISKVAKEAELTVSDGIYNCIVFSQPCDVSKGDLINAPLHAFITKDIMASRDDHYYIKLIEKGRLEQKCSAN